MAPVTRFFLDARTATSHFPGIGRYVGGLAEALPEQLLPGERLTLLVDPAAARRAVRSAGSTLLPVPASPFGLSQQWRLPQALRGADLYHSPYYLMPYRPGIPTVLTVYDLIPHLLPKTVSLQARLMFLLALRLALRASARVIAISETTRSDMLAAFPRLAPERVTAVPLAADARFSPQSPAEIERIRRRHGLPGDFGLYVGINKPHKNLVRLVEAWAGLGTDLPLVIAGDWDDRYPEARLAAGSQPPGRVRFLGRIPGDDLPALYSACRLFVFPSLYEGFGLPVVEALACGAAVACSGTSSLPEVGGAAAVYFDPGDAVSIRRAVADALSAPRTRGDRSGRQPASPGAQPQPPRWKSTGLWPIMDRDADQTHPFCRRPDGGRLAGRRHHRPRLFQHLLQQDLRTG